MRWLGEAKQRSVWQSNGKARHKTARRGDGKARQSMDPGSNGNARRGEETKRMATEMLGTVMKGDAAEEQRMAMETRSGDVL